MIYTKYLFGLVFILVIIILRCDSLSPYQIEYMNDDDNNNNCYSYAFNNTHIKYKGKPQPGFYSNIKQVKRNNASYNCKNFISRVLNDYPDSKFISVKDHKRGKRCNGDEYTIFLAIDNEGVSTDYHFYKEDNNGFWSHKPGLGKVVYTDDGGRKITNPIYADRDYENTNTNDENNYNYKTECGFFCNKK
jgi:hypothetical protein